MMDQNESKDVLKGLLGIDDAVVLLMKGDWGIGKTYFWNDFVETEFDDEQKKKYAYVSLFGKKNIEAIQNDILLQVFSRNKHIEKINGVLKTLKGVFSGGQDGEGVSLGLTGEAIGMALSLFKKDDLSDLVICIDDFERKSSDLEYIEIMGFASILKERYSCKIVLIMDEERIHGEDKYFEYKEKLVDCEFVFSPNQSEVIKNILEAVDPRCLNGVSEAMSLIPYPNLRIVKKVVWNVNRLSSILGEDCTDWGAAHVAYYAALLTCVYYGLGPDGLSQLSDFKLHEKIEAGDCSPDLIAYSKNLGWIISSHVKLQSLLWEILHTSNIDRLKLIESVKEREKSQDKNSISTRFLGVVERYEYDMKMSGADFLSTMEQLFSEVGCFVFEYISMNNIDFLFDTMCVVSGDSKKYEEMYSALKRKYVDEIFAADLSYKDVLSIFRDSTVKAVCYSDDNLKKEFGERCEKLRDRMYKKEDVIEHLETIRKNSGWGESDKDFLNGITVAFVETHLREDPEFFDSVMRFVRWGGSGFPEFYKNVREAIERLKDELGEFRYQRIVRDFT